MQLKLDPDLDFQQLAIQSVVGLFEGLDRRVVNLGLEYGYDIVPNLPPEQLLYDTDLFMNLAAIQIASNIPETDRARYIEHDEGMMLKFVSNDSIQYSNFTIEMETGTGKTYVYLRTVYELNRAYSFRKFIVVVPSIAIFEGVIKNFEIAKSHFASLFHNVTINLTRYEGEHLGSLRSFATSPFIEIMVMTLASFNSANNVIFRASERLPGERLPYEYIQETRPILILDEPQNMSSELSKEALRTLNPLFALRYSATHRESPNLVYLLTPFEAFQKGLVKRIRVKGITHRENFNRPFLILDEVIPRRGRKPVAKVRTFKQHDDGPREEIITLEDEDNLHAKTGRDDHKDGYIVREIAALKGQEPFVEFENGIRLTTTDTAGPIRRDLFRLQIAHTIDQHMLIQKRLQSRGIKVLSLFFIDRVANYVDEDGIIKMLFDEEFAKIKKRFPTFADLEPGEVRSAYFAQRKNKETGEDEAIDTPIEESARRNKAIRAAEKSAFKLIMQDKERLLSFDEPVSFIFAHSALKEGWDNPNVFQICTLNQTVSPLKKRQEIGRGLRICVNQDGERVFGSDVNVLTVIANESYENYARSLQAEYEDEGHTEAPPKPTNADREPAVRRDDRFEMPEFRTFWEKLSRKAKYQISIDTDKLIERCVERLNNRVFPKPIHVVQEGEYVKTAITLRLMELSEGRAHIAVETKDTLGKERTFSDWHEAGDHVAPDDQHLRGFKVAEIVDDGDASYVLFSNKKELYLDTTLEYETQEGQTVRETKVLAEQEYHPVFNLLDRVVNEVGLTRKTILKVFQQMDSFKKALILKNPEGFTAIFLNTVRQTLADHVAERIEFTLDPSALDWELEELFPPERDFPQRELVESPANGLYSKSQVDSDVEKRFIEDRLERDENVLSYFKFPPKFKLDFPKGIGNYNPDWGILRRNEDAVVVELVRETKGAIDPKRLQYPQERRKIESAKRYFREVGLDYRHVTDQTADWYLPADQVLEQQIFEEAAAHAERPRIRIIPNDDSISWDEAFKTLLPVYSLKAAAGYFGSGEHVEPEGWIEVGDLGKKLDDKMFVAQAVGRSMEPRIKDGDYCVFRADVVGSREGKIVLAQYRGPEDPDTGGSFTVKRYSSKKVASDDSGWKHSKIVLSPINPGYAPIELEPEDEDDISIIAEFLSVVLRGAK